MHDFSGGIVRLCLAAWICLSATQPARASDLEWLSLFPFIKNVPFLSELFAGDEKSASSSLFSLPKAKLIHGKVYYEIWGDEFSGRSINSRNWYTGTGRRKDGYWHTNAVSQANGNLVLKTFKNAKGYNGGALISKREFKPGGVYFEIRIKFKEEEGHWPTFWLCSNSMLTNNLPNGGWDGAEIDIVEKGIIGDYVQHTLHWDGYQQYHQSLRKNIKIRNIRSGFHTFGMLWTQNQYEFFVNGVHSYTVTPDMVGGICQEPMWMVISDEIGAWSGNIAKAHLPDYSYVDYIRVYSR